VVLNIEECSCKSPSFGSLSCDFTHVSASQKAVNNPDHATIEGALFEALIAAGAVSQDNSDDPVKVSLDIPYYEGERSQRLDTLR
jgi:hypothetical protein